MANSSPSNGAKPASVLFVCLGNICRSPMAEGAFRHLTSAGTSNQNPLIGEIDSCGTGAYHAGDYSDSRTMSVLRDNGITNYKHQARRVNIPEDFKKFDYIIAMDADNLMDLRDMVKRAKKNGQLNGNEMEKLHLYGEFGGKTKEEEIGDPYYGGRDGFEIAYKQDEMPITLYFLQTSRAVRIAWLLEELGLDSNVEYHDREANMDTPMSYRFKPGMAVGRSPGISDGNVNLIESVAIAEYLCEKYDKSSRLLPNDPAVRANVRMWMYASDGTFFMHGLSILYCSGAAPDSAEAISTCLTPQGVQAGVVS
ncbi:low molecular weight phosphotyrosine protein phosphatase [Acrodontium crateriforme]|uniref:Low molecular weight phosphotyrosine protein phosphatase n=1 Tax=Acrodontium crateriforme TaxID=150365 RepID=A0AAQ3R8C1_9PEZI|nr:low molecular weight phosphotyrosine protein phosphatase [Acrodontium crateriforme]